MYNFKDRLFFFTKYRKIKKCNPTIYHPDSPVLRNIPIVALMFCIDTRQNPKTREHPVAFITQILPENVSGLISHIYFTISYYIHTHVKPLSC